MHDLRGAEYPFLEVPILPEKAQPGMILCRINGELQVLGRNVAVKLLLQKYNRAAIEERPGKNEQVISHATLPQKVYR
jgi:hypothetical protein